VADSGKTLTVIWSRRYLLFRQLLAAEYATGSRTSLIRSTSFICIRSPASSTSLTRLKGIRSRARLRRSTIGGTRAHTHKGGDGNRVSETLPVSKLWYGLTSSQGRGRLQLGCGPFLQEMVGVQERRPEREARTSGIKGGHHGMQNPLRYLPFFSFFLFLSTFSKSTVCL
jgi:hypothetical protein